jgi:peptidase M50B-like protein
MKVLLALVLVCGTAHADPSNERLVLVGLALAPADYLIGVSMHEGSHALAAKLVGAEVDELHLFPPGIDPHTKTFRFGWTYVRGLRTRNDRVLFYIAPKITDAVLIGGFAALVFTGAWPTNKYAQLGLTVAGTGLWVDFAKDVVLFSPHNDVTKVFDNWCMTGWRQIPARVVYAALDVGFAYVVYRGFKRTFDEPTSATPLVVPLLSTAF